VLAKARSNLTASQCNADTTERWNFVRTLQRPFMAQRQQIFCGNKMAEVKHKERKKE
jgi:hypothetical protein